MSTSLKVDGSVPGYSSLHAEVSLGKIPNRELPPMYQLECVCAQILDKVLRYRKKAHVWMCLCDSKSHSEGN